MAGTTPIASAPIGDTGGAGSSNAPVLIEAWIAHILMLELAALGDSLDIDVAWPNMAFDPDAGTYLKADILFNATANDFVADDSTIQYRGIFQVTVVAPALSGTIAALNVAGNVTAHFDRVRLELNDYVVHTAGKPSLGPMSTQPDRLRIPVSIAFYAFH